MRNKPSSKVPREEIFWWIWWILDSRAYTRPIRAGRGALGGQKRWGLFFFRLLVKLYLQHQHSSTNK